VLITQAEGRDILTVEGLSKNGELDILQRAFIDEGAVQCGYCTPGMLMSAKALLMKNVDPIEEDIRRALAGNLCRCTGYTKIVQAVKKVASEMKKGVVL
jgi:carbon-monoxide dehydrogenase small subunit